LNHIQEHMDLAQSPAYQMVAMMLNHQVVLPQAQPIPTQDGGTGEMLDGAPPVVQQAQGIEPAGMPNPPAGTDPVSAAIIEGNQQ
jgi:hypothetical protein